MAEDYYSILGVGRDAGADEIKAAYRKLALKHHPDRNQGDKDSEEKFKKISEAYSVLSSPEKRAHYDRFGSMDGMGQGRGGDPFAGFGGFGGFGDMFEDIFGAFTGQGGRQRSRSTRGNDLRYDLEMTLEEAAAGIRKELDILSWRMCSVCDGTGSESKQRKACPDCKGRGQVHFQQGFFTISKTCSRCGGTGQHVTDPCRSCGGAGRKQEPRKETVSVPAGVDTGLRLKIGGQGEPGVHGGPPGDLFIVITVKDHEFFERDGDDLYCEVPINIPQAVLGADIDVPTLEGTAKVKVPSGTQPRTSFRLKGKGMPHLGTGRKGDLYVVVNLVVPRKLSQKQKELMQEFAGHLGADESVGFAEKIRNLFAGKA